MAQIVTTFDSIEKTLSVTIDGKAVSNVLGVNVYQSYDDEGKFRCCVETGEKDKENDMFTYHRVCASKSKVISDIEKACGA